MNDPARIVWKSGRRFSCFFDGDDRATIVGNVLVDDARGFEIGTALFVVDESDALLDIELREVIAGPALRQPPSPAIPVVTDVSTMLSRERRPTIGADGSWLVVDIDPSAAGDWVRVGETQVYLCVSASDLVAIAYQAPTWDTTGALEQAWLDAIGSDPDIGRIRQRLDA